MKRMAFFVEGLTEVIFVSKLIEAVADRNSFVVEQRRILGGASVPRQVSTIKAAAPTGGEEFYFLIFDCGGDHQVASRLREEHASLTANGYSALIGLRDVFPDYAFADIPALRTGLMKYIKTSLAPVEFVLSVMEVEAWFLAEHTHFERIDASLTTDAIAAALGFDPSVADMSARPAPAADLVACYQLAGKDYVKAEETTLGALDYESIFLELGGKLPDLARLNAAIDNFLTREQATA